MGCNASGQAEASTHPEQLQQQPTTFKTCSVQCLALATPVPSTGSKGSGWQAGVSDRQQQNGPPGLVLTASYYVPQQQQDQQSIERDARNLLRKAPLSTACSSATRSSRVSDDDPQPSSLDVASPPYTATQQCHGDNVLVYTLDDACANHAAMRPQFVTNQAVAQQGMRSSNSMVGDEESKGNGYDSNAQVKSDRGGEDGYDMHVEGDESPGRGLGEVRTDSILTSIVSFDAQQGSQSTVVHHHEVPDSCHPGTSNDKGGTSGLDKPPIVPPGEQVCTPSDNLHVATNAHRGSCDTFASFNAGVTPTPAAYHRRMQQWVAAIEGHVTSTYSAKFDDDSFDEEDGEYINVVSVTGLLP